MTSKNSFLTNIYENMKRRIWPLALFTLVLLFLYPVRIAITLGNVISWQETPLNLQKSMFTYMGFDATTVVIVAFGAILSALQGFSWLYQKKKVDMYMSQPISAKRLFAANYVSGIITFFGPFILTQWITIVISFIMGANSSIMQINNLYSLLISFLFFFAVYNVTILAMMLCGHMAVAGLATGTFLFYEYIIIGIIAIYYDTYFRTFSSRYTEFWKNVLSPFHKAIEMCGYTKDIWEKNEYTMSFAWEYVMSRMGAGMAWFLVLGVITLILAIWCFVHRPMENSDKAIAFPKIKQPVKVVMIVTGGLGGSVCLYSFSEEKTAFAILGLVSGVLICQFLMEIIYDFDIKSFLKGKSGLVVGAVISVLIYMSFSLDLFGYDSYIPKEEEVASAAIGINFYTDIPNRVIEEDYNVSWSWETPIEKMELTNISPILKLAQHGMGRNEGKFEHVDYITAEICYHMKNGRDIYRYIPIDYEADAAILDELFMDTQYKAISQLSEDLQGFYQMCDASYSNGIESQKVLDKNAGMLMEYYRQDYMAMSFSDVKSTFPCGIITLSYMSYGYPNTVEYPVYPTYDRTIAYLEGKGIKLQGKIDPEAISSIEVFNYNYTEEKYSPEELLIMENSEMAVSVVESRTESIVYEDKEQIEAILNGLVSSNLMDYRYISDYCVDDLDVAINMAENETAYKYDWYSMYMQFAKDTVPEFVCEDLKYDPERMD